MAKFLLDSDAASFRTARISVWVRACISLMANLLKQQYSVMMRSVKHSFYHLSFRESFFNLYRSVNLSQQGLGHMPKIVEHPKDPVYVYRTNSGRNDILRIGEQKRGKTRYAVLKTSEARKVAYALLLQIRR